MIALLLILPTVAFVPIYFFIFPALLMLKRNIDSNYYRFGEHEKLIINRNLLIIALIVLCTALNKWLHWYNELEGVDLVPRTLAMFVAFFIAKNLTKKDYELIVLFIVIECLIVCFQYFVGINSFYDEYSHFNDALNRNPDLLYSRRPLGMSENSSTVAYKFFIAYIILDYFKLKGLIYNSFRLILIFGIFFTFNRTVFLAAFVYIFYSIIKLYSPVIDQLLRSIINVKYIKYVILAFFGFVGLIFFYNLYFDIIFAQVTRGNGFDLSGRGGIWRDFSIFINDHFYFGNGSVKVYVPYRGKEAHAHNSFLQIIATDGILIFSVYMYMVISNLKKSNFIYIILILVYLRNKKKRMKLLLKHNIAKTLLKKSKLQMILLLKLKVKKLW
jgi:hypothetical protein